MTVYDDLTNFTEAPWGELGRSATLAVVALWSKFVLNVMNKTTIVNHEEFLRHIMQRPEDVGLITVSNHTSQFFQSGKALPIERGAGPDQPVMHAVARVVALGRWLHIFPEGKVNYTGQLAPLRWGVGKIICDAIGRHGAKDPVVLPLYHSGMGEVLPKNSTLPRWGKQVTVVVGQPVDLSDLTCNCNKEGVDQREVWRQITVRIGHALKELERQAPPNRDQVPRNHAGEQRRSSEGSLPAGLGESKAE
ncbi:hypothetical protein N2152v2_006307 [Parachlorella kessleri]